MAQKDPDVRELLREGNKVAALRLYRERYGVGLKEAKDAIDALESDDGVTGYPTPPEQREQLTDLTFREGVEARLRAGQLIAAVRMYREQCDVPLHVAKRDVLAWKHLLELDRSTDGRALEEPIETFAIRWNSILHPAQHFLPWKQAEASVEFRFELQIGERAVGNSVPVSWRELVASTEADGKFEVFVGDYDIDGRIEIVYIDDLVLWYDPEDWNHWHLLDAAQYKTAINLFHTALLELPQLYPGQVIKFAFDFNHLNPGD